MGRWLHFKRLWLRFKVKLPIVYYPNLHTSLILDWFKPTVFFHFLDEKAAVRVLEKDLPILHGVLFSSLDSIGRSQVAHLLKQLGVKSFTPKDVINSHILPTLKSDKWKVFTFEKIASIWLLLFFFFLLLGNDFINKFETWKKKAFLPNAVLWRYEISNIRLRCKKQVHFHADIAFFLLALLFMGLSPRDPNILP